ncbi:pyridoxal phosphate-dependent aminotransferase [Sulfobacillus harzensis]|uniref:pyridoxal phosphate-dependent aminotransferase n=1 Tax=Sulfobacillus harzensis TaxID=2729629 RepID=UPI00308456D7
MPGLFLAFRGVAGPGDEILVPDPGWPDYLGGMRSLGIRPVPYPLTPPHYLPNMATMDQLITAATRAVVVNFPGNPTGQVAPPDVVQALVDWAERHDLWIVSDEVYDQIVFDGQPLSPAHIDPERTLGVYSFSKTYAMTGWRLGYLAGPPSAIASLTKVAMGIWSSVSEPLQYAGLAALEGPQAIVEDRRRQYQRRRDAAVEYLDRVQITHSNPDGAFYLLVHIAESGLSSRDFALRLLDQAGVAVAPGSAFGEMAEGFVRISLASPETDILRGLARLAAFLGHA